MEFSCWFWLASLSLSLCALQVCIPVFLRRCHLLLWIYSLVQQLGKVNRESRNYISSTEKLTQHKWTLENFFPLMCPVWSGIIPGTPCFTLMSSTERKPQENRSWLIGKDSDAGKDWGQEEKGATEDEMVGWHHWLHGHEFEQALGDGGTGKPGVLQSMGSQRVRHDWAAEREQQLISDLLGSLHIPWSFSRVKRRKFLAGVFLLHKSMEKPLTFPCMHLLHYYLAFRLLGGVLRMLLYTRAQNVHFENNSMLWKWISHFDPLSINFSQPWHPVS